MKQGGGLLLDFRPSLRVENYASLPNLEAAIVPTLWDYHLDGSGCQRYALYHLVTLLL
jgi:hypothetical protein